MNNSTEITNLTDAQLDTLFAEKLAERNDKKDETPNFERFANGDYNSDCPLIGKVAEKVKHTYNQTKPYGRRVSFVGLNKNEIGKGRKFRIAVEMRIEDDIVREMSRINLRYS